MDKFHNQLKVSFASQYAFAIKAQNFHWNVEGNDFYQLHLLFERIYEEAYGAVDDFAENLRKVGAYAPASLYRFSTLSTIDDQVAILDPRSMIMSLLDDCEKMQEIMKVVYTLAEDLGEYGLANFLAERQDAFGKHAWFLRATLKGN